MIFVIYPAIFASLNISSGKGKEFNFAKLCQTLWSTCKAKKSISKFGKVQNHE